MNIAHETPEHEKKSTEGKAFMEWTIFLKVPYPRETPWKYWKQTLFVFSSLGAMATQNQLSKL